MKQKLYIDALRDGLSFLLREDDEVYLIGEDIIDPYGGAFKVTKSLSTSFPGKLLPAPMSEQSYTGFAIGMALGGLKPIIEIMFGDFLTLAMDQLLNHGSKFIGLYKSALHMVVRAPMGGHRGYGATHSQSIERLVFGIPHVKVIAPSIIHDPEQLIVQSVHNGEIIVFIENKLDYGRVMLPNDESEKLLCIEEGNGSFPLAISKIKDAESCDIVIIAYGGAVAYAIEAQRALFMEDEICMKLICPSDITGLNIHKIIVEIGLCKVVCIAEEGISDFGWGEHVANMLREEHFYGKIKRIGALYEVICASEADESRQLLTTERILEGVYELLKE